MIAGTTLGLVSYFVIGFYVAALVGAAVSLAVLVLFTWIAPRDFDWRSLAEAEPRGTAGATGGAR
jgi:O-antigen/teichoic acid export membrane protein